MSTDPKITRDMERKAKQVLMDIYNKEVMNHSMEELRNKFNKLISENEEPMKPNIDTDVQQIIKMHNGGLIL